MTSWEGMFDGADRAVLEQALAAWIFQRRWFRTKTKTIERVRFRDVFAIPFAKTRSRIVLVDVELEGGEVTTYVVPLTFLEGDEAREFRARSPSEIVLSIVGKGDAQDGVFVDALTVEAFLSELLDAFEVQATLRSGADTLTMRVLAPFNASGLSDRTPRTMAREQTNTSVLFGDRVIAKIFRKLDEGPSADLEMGRFLTDVGYAHAPELAGWIEFHHPQKSAEPTTVAVMHVQVPNRGDAWAHALESLKTWFADVLRRERAPAPALPPRHLLTMARLGLPPDATRAVGDYVHHARKLGHRIGQMHAALVSQPDNPAFSAEPLDLATRLGLVHHAESSFTRALGKIATQPSLASGTAGNSVCEIRNRQGEIETRLRSMTSLDDAGKKTRVHGDLHLGQVLFTGSDFMLIDFEGEPARTPQERREKRSPLVDIAGMLRSYDYAAATALALRDATERMRLLPWAKLWKRAASVSLLEGWIGAVSTTDILPKDAAAERVLLDFFLFEKCIYEIGYEMDNRPDWLEIPVAGLLELLVGGP
ncbi:MAG: putative maltokinase [Polyangiaceae bacterium]|nr:putative maltokinase [Polyangiaceae bacterium]